MVRIQPISHVTLPSNTTAILQAHWQIHFYTSKDLGHVQSERFLHLYSRAKGWFKSYNEMAVKLASRSEHLYHEIVMVASCTIDRQALEVGG